MLVTNYGLKENITLGKTCNKKSKTEMSTSPSNFTYSK